MDEFLERYPFNPKTAIAYRSHLKNFFEVIGENPDTYFQNERDYEKDFRTYFSFMLKNRIPPHTRKNRISCVKKFLEEHDIELKPRVLNGLKTFARTSEKGSVSKERVPTQAELKQILQHAKINAKALFLMSCSSGMRIGELLQLTYDDIHLDENPVRIIIKADYTKTNAERIALFQMRQRMR